MHYQIWKFLDCWNFDKIKIFMLNTPFNENFRFSQNSPPPPLTKFFEGPGTRRRAYQTIWYLPFGQCGSHDILWTIKNHLKCSLEHHESQGFRENCWFPTPSPPQKKIRLERKIFEMIIYCKIGDITIDDAFNNEYMFDSPFL